MTILQLEPNSSTLTEKLRELEREDIIEHLGNVRREIIETSQIDPTELIVWLYENQGEMRFGAENRLYLILADSKRLYRIMETKESVFANRA